MAKMGKYMHIQLYRQIMRERSPFLEYKQVLYYNIMSRGSCVQTTPIGLGWDGMDSPHCMSHAPCICVNE